MRSVAARADELAIDALVLRGHHVVSEARLELLAAGLARNAVDILDRLHEVVELGGGYAADAVAQDLRARAAGARDYRRAAGERLDHGEAERLRPIDGEHQGQRVAEEFI